LVAEVIKMFVSGYLSVTDKSTDTDTQGKGLNKLLWLTLNSRKIILLVVLYSTANILAFYALERVEASVYTVLMQTKIVTTAVFAIIMLGRNISGTKRRALLLLVVGCVLVASPAFNKHTCAASGSEEDQLSVEDQRSADASAIVGVMCILTMVTISGYSSIYFESMLKKSNERISIWDRNYQLAQFSIVFLIAVVVGETVQQGGDVSTVHHGMFQGWTTSAVIISIVQAAGGLLVAATLKYADAILKTLATSGAIVMSAVLNWMLLGGTLDIFVGLGCISTILAIFNYILSVDPPKSDVATK
jgi:solute carrier family 35 (UDP-sugar transporter), member A1/2/3